MDALGRSSRRSLRLGKAIILVFILVGIGFLLGRFTGDGNETGRHPPESPQTAGPAEPTTWTCSMHPQIRQPDPGKCPICFMDLIPLKQDGGEKLGPRMMRMSEAAMKLAEIKTVEVERRFVDVEIPLAGRVDYDETRVKTISAWVPGRLDRLFVDYTGVPVRAGDHLVEMYSPELYAAQEELIQALKTAKNVKSSDSEFARRTALETVDASREKLHLLGLTAQQIEEIETQGTPSAAVEIKAPIGGIVIHKNAKEGMYVKTGTPIYTLADLSKVWVRLDAYETDLPWIRYGQEVEIRTEAYGDRISQGWISFIDPVLDPKTRTVSVRVIVENPKGEFLPNMFVRAKVKARAAGEREVVSRNLEGKHICPMHPEVVKDHPGVCDSCGMALARAEALGYFAPEEIDPPLVVPASAVLTTGKRAIVYVRVPGRESPTFEGVEVELGPRAENHYIIRSGLSAGQEVVVNGNFKIDSALQLQAKPSMMTPAGEDPADKETAAGLSRIKAPQTFRRDLAGLFVLYLEIQQALADDNPEEAGAAGKRFQARLDSVATDDLSPEAKKTWIGLQDSMGLAMETLTKSVAIQIQRERFAGFSAAIERAVRRFGPLPEVTVRRFFCPMAFDNKGAFWLQEKEGVSNPYFGETMLRCGEMTEILSRPEEEGDRDHDR